MSKNKRSVIDMKNITYLFAILMLSISCKKKEAEVSEIPSLSIVSVTPTLVKQFKDSIIVIASYTDGNGDIGRQDPDANALSIKDARLALPDYYHIPPITPDNAALNTRGKLRIVIPSLFLLGSGKSEKTNIKIKVKDLAGNWSNEITTPEITISE